MRVRHRVQIVIESMEKGRPNLLVSKVPLTQSQVDGDQAQSKDCHRGLGNKSSLSFDAAHTEPRGWVSVTELRLS